MLGFYPIDANLEILARMQGVNNAMLLLGLVFSIVLFVFMVISILLIYSLLMIGVETKTLETGIMRMVGTNKRGLIMMVGIQSAMFVIPAVGTAFILSFGFIAVFFKYVFKV
jgi:ABC-type antimicrobial peptide transport system permease subunit